MTAAPEVEEPAWCKRPYAKYDTVDKWVCRHVPILEPNTLRVCSNRPLW